MFCTNCGAQIADDAVFCPFCGNRTDSVDNGSSESYAYEQPQVNVTPQMSDVPPVNDMPPVNDIPPVNNIPPASNPQSPGSVDDNIIVMKILLGISAAISAIMAVWNGFQGLRSIIANIGQLFSSIRYHYSGEMPWVIPYMIANIMVLIRGVIFIALAAVLIFGIIKWIRGKGQDILVSVVCLGILGIAVGIIQLLFAMIGSGMINSYYGGGFAENFSWVFKNLFLFNLLPNVVIVGLTIVGFVVIKDAIVNDGVAMTDKVKTSFANNVDMIKSASNSAPVMPAKTSGVNEGNPQVNEPVAAAPVYQAGVPLKTDRSLITYVLLTLITCGIYAYFFIYKLAQDVNVACDGDGKQTSGLLKFILLSIVTCGFYAWYWYYSLGNRLASNAPRYGLSFSENGTTVLMWLIFGSLICGIGPFVAWHILIKNTNAICVAYNTKSGFYGQA